MTTAPVLNKTSTTTIKEIIKPKKLALQVACLLFLVLFIIIKRYSLITQTFEYGTDEGINLIKSLLYSQGLLLYSQIWNDQPPLFTILLSNWLDLFGSTVVAARFLVVFFCVLLVWCFYQIIRQTNDFFPSAIATLFLLTSWSFLSLGSYVMIGIPSLSLAMLSIYFLTLYQRKPLQLYLLIFSGISFGLSLQIKLFTAFLIPILAFHILEFSFKPSQFIEKRKPLLIWLASLAIIFLAIGISSGQFSHYSQVILSHLNQPSVNTGEIAIVFDNKNFLLYLLQRERKLLYLLALIGLLPILLKKKTDGFIPIIWLGLIMLILVRHKPIWHHYFTLISIPVCWLSAYGISGIFALLKVKEDVDSLWKSLKRLAPYLLTAILIFLVIKSTPEDPFTLSPKGNTEVLKIISTYKKSTNWMFTDRPIYAFRNGLRVPPETAVISFKRLNSGSLNTKDILKVLKNYRPEQILLARWVNSLKSDQELLAYIEDDYSKDYTDEIEHVEHYLLKSISTAPQFPRLQSRLP